MTRLALIIAVALIFSTVVLSEAYEFGNNWPWGSCASCPKNKQVYKHTGHDTSGNKVGQKVYFRRSGVVKSIHLDSKGWGYIVVFESNSTSFNIIHLKDVAVKVGKSYKVTDNKGIYVGKVADLSKKGAVPHIHVSQASTSFDKKKEPWFWAGGLPQCNGNNLPAFPWKYVPPDNDLVRF